MHPIQKVQLYPVYSENYNGIQNCNLITKPDLIMYSHCHEERSQDKESVAKCLQHIFHAALQNSDERIKSTLEEAFTRDLKLLAGETIPLYSLLAQNDKVTPLNDSCPSEKQIEIFSSSNSEEEEDSNPSEDLENSHSYSLPRVILISSDEEEELDDSNPSDEQIEVSPSLPNVIESTSAVNDSALSEQDEEAVQVLGFFQHKIDEEAVQFLNRLQHKIIHEPKKRKWGK